MGRPPRLVRLLALAVAVASVASPAAEAAVPGPCDGVAQMPDATGDGHHQPTDLEAAWLSEESGHVQAVVRVHLGTWAPQHGDALRVEAGYAVTFTVGGVRRYVRATVPEAGTGPSAYDYGTWTAAGGFASEGATTGWAEPVTYGPAALVIDVPTALVPDGASLGDAFALTYDGVDGATYGWVDRAPGGTSPTEAAFGATFVVGACAASSTTRTVRLSGPARVVGARRIVLRGSVIPGRAGVAVRVARGGRVVARTVSAAGGRFSVAVMHRERSTYVATAEGVASAALPVAVTSRVRIAARRLASGAVDVRGWTSPALPGSALVLLDVGIVPSARRAVSGGRFVLSLRRLPPGRYQVVYIPAGGRADRATSNTVRIP